MKVKFTIERDINKDDYAKLVKYFKAMGCVGSFGDFCQRYYLEHLDRIIRNQWLPKAKRYFEEGQSQLSRVRDIVDAREIERCPSIRARLPK